MPVAANFSGMPNYHRLAGADTVAASFEHSTPEIMARRKFRHSPRPTPPTEITHQEYLINQPSPLMNRTELLRLINGGEDTYLELKVKLSNSEKIAQGIVALANTAGGTIVFGVNDQLRIEGLSHPSEVMQELSRICREDIVPPVVPLMDVISFDSGKRIVALDIEPRKRPYRTRDGRYYMRFGDQKREVSRELISDWLDELRPLGYENIPFYEMTVEDFDDGLLWTFAKAYDDSVPANNLYDTEAFLKKDLLLAIGNIDTFYPTVAAALLFAKSERIPQIFPRAKVKVSRFAGDYGSSQLIDSNEFSGNLLAQNEDILNFILRHCDLLKERPKRNANAEQSPFVPRAGYHIYSVREAVANLLIHRDYAFRDIQSRINIYDNSIEFINARRTNGFVPPASRAIRFGITQRLNPQIASIFLRREYGAKVPQGGLPMILKQSERISGKRAEIYTANDEFKLKIFGI